MNRVFLTMALFGCFLVFTGLKTSQTKGKMTIVFSGVKQPSGRIYLGLFASPDGYPEDKKKAALIDNFKVNATTLSYITAELPFGTYAMAYYHDENDNGKMDSNMFGMPLEGYGFSNNAKAVFSAPAFEKTKFRFDAQHTTIQVTPIY